MDLRRVQPPPDAMRAPLAAGNAGYGIVGGSVRPDIWANIGHILSGDPAKERALVLHLLSGWTGVKQWWPYELRPEALPDGVAVTVHVDVSQSREYQFAHPQRAVGLGRWMRPRRVVVLAKVNDRHTLDSWLKDIAQGVTQGAEEVVVHVDRHPEYRLLDHEIANVGQAWSTGAHLAVMLFRLFV